MFRYLLLAILSFITVSSYATEQGIELSVSIKAPVSEVWKAWTTSTGITSFFAPEAQVDARPDGAFHIYMDPYGKPGLKGADDMRVLAVETEKLLSFTWNAPPHLAEARKQRTVVILRFAPEGDFTRLTLSHVGWGEGGEWPKARAYFANAWPFVLKNLQTRFETDRPMDWSSWLENLKKLHEAENSRK